MSSSQLKLYVDSKFISPYVLSAFVALHEKQLTFDIASVNLAAKDGRSSDFTATSITQRVPAIRHGEFCLCESSAITEYIDEAFAGAPLCPKTPQLPALAR